jgi:HAMP domain-containing protein
LYSIITATSLGEIAMGIIDGFGFNFYSLVLMESVSLWLVTAFSFALIPNKSVGLKNLLTAFILGVVFITGYVFTQGFYEENRIARIVSLVVIPFQHIATFMYINNFPTVSNSKRFKYYTRVLLTFATIIGIFVIYKGLQSKLIFDFSGQYYELDMPEVIRVYSFLVIITTFSVVFTTIYKSFKASPEDRIAQRWMLIPIFLGFFLPSISYTLNKSGYIGRSAYITAFSIAGLIAVFIWIIVFINHTEDRTTFLFKIIGVSFSVFILIVGSITYIVYDEREKTYDANNLLELKYLPSDPTIYSPDLQYFISCDMENFKIQIDNKSDSIQLDSYTSASLLKTALYMKLQKYEKDNVEIEENFPGELLKNVYTNAYWKYIYAMAPLPRDKNAILEHFSVANKQLFYKYNKIKEIPLQNFSQDLGKYLDKESASLSGISDIVREYVQNSSQETSILKQEVMSFFKPVIMPEERNYSIDFSGKHKFIIYNFYFEKNNRIYQAAYSYKAYREYLHEIGMKIFYVVSFGILLFVFGIPLFLSKILIRPLSELLEGVKKVRKGNLEIEVPVKVFDEIGFLATAFNHMVGSIKESKQKLKEYAEKLEEKVEERTKELMLTLSQVEKLKEQQDGDYFLTTLLLKPFFVNNTTNSKLKIDFYVKQKKEFSFRKKNYQIGGDLCISQTIELRGKKYVVFLNADAMGKSIQGAGGILVLGAVFQSIIQRTMTYKIQSEVYPERWIKMAFKEMHKIFESFDGTMLVSLIFGLIEERTGLVYYINAEHPWLILYRDGVASFLENELLFRKLGHVGVHSELFISTFQMQPGDLLVMGSDGKDDLILSKSEDSRQINEDESLILKRIEESKGDINLMFDIIKDRYELVDDFSVMSIQYPETDRKQEMTIKDKVSRYIKMAQNHITRNGNFEKASLILETAIQELGNQPELLEVQIKTYMKLKKYKEASDLCKVYLSENEVDTQMLFKASYCLKMNREFEESIEMSERVKLREPRNIRNLVHLADLYAYTKNVHRAEKILKKILTIDPLNKKARLIQQKIESGN